MDYSRFLLILKNTNKITYENKEFNSRRTVQKIVSIKRPSYTTVGWLI